VGLVDRVLRRAELDTRAALLDAQELVVVIVRLEADVLARREAHHGQLVVLAGEEHGSERVIVERRLLDVAYPSEHRLVLLGSWIQATRGTKISPLAVAGLQETFCRSGAIQV
jgi:hypothetical protein